MDCITTSFELSQKILDLQIICCRKDIEIFKLKKQINDMINITVLNIKKDNIEIEIKDTNALVEEIKEVKKEKMIQVKVNECGDCRSEERRSFPTKGYRCEDEECMNFK
jgi:sRNA-binding carbon storage regulator CsrA